MRGLLILGTPKKESTIFSQPHMSKGVSLMDLQEKPRFLMHVILGLRRLIERGRSSYVRRESFQLLIDYVLNENFYLQFTAAQALDFGFRVWVYGLRFRAYGLIQVSEGADIFVNGGKVKFAVSESMSKVACHLLAHSFITPLKGPETLNPKLCDPFEGTLCPKTLLPMQREQLCTSPGDAKT